jgi:hypothetical protein
MMCHFVKQYMIMAGLLLHRFGGVRPASAVPATLVQLIAIIARL